MTTRDAVLREVIAVLTQHDGIGSRQEAVEVVEHMRKPGEPKQPLTARQREVYDFIVEYRHHNNSLSPTTRDIQQVFKYASQTAAVQVLRVLADKKWISLTAKVSRSAIPL